MNLLSPSEVQFWRQTDKYAATGANDCSVNYWITSRKKMWMISCENIPALIWKNLFEVTSVQVSQTKRESSKAVRCLAVVWSMFLECLPNGPNVRFNWQVKPSITLRSSPPITWGTMQARRRIYISEPTLLSIAIVQRVRRQRCLQTGMLCSRWTKNTGTPVGFVWTD